MRPRTTLTPSAPDSPAAPTFDFPPDVKVVIDADATGDPTKDAILRDQAYGEKAIFLAIAKLDTKLPVFQKYVVGKAGADWIVKIHWGKTNHKTVTGTTSFYNRKVTITGPTSACVTFCESERNAYDKDTETGKIAKTTPSLDDFTFHTALMSKAADGTWQMSDYRSQHKAKSCER
jgi:hypothetical protein